MKNRINQKGAVLAEYAIAAAILVPIFAVLGVALKLAVQSRGIASLRSVEITTPINEHLAELRRGAAEESGDLTYQDEH
jgi:hypothetical protein